MYIVVSCSRWSSGEVSTLSPTRKSHRRTSGTNHVTLNLQRTLLKILVFMLGNMDTHETYWRESDSNIMIGQSVVTPVSAVA